MNTPPNREVALFSAALELPAAQRATYLGEACADDPALRLRVEALLRVHDEAIPFLEAPPPGMPDSPVGDAASNVTVRIFSSPSEKPGDSIGRYKLLQQIGEGGCGVVYMAQQDEPVRRRVALKVIKLGMDTKQVIARFEAERQALALMDHPNIAKVLDAGATDAGRPYFVMELVRGIKITQYCDENNLSTRERLNLFIEVCHAIQHAHQKGIIHRDIKPSNILVTVSDPGAPACSKVIDFGIAKATTGQPLTDKTVFTAFEQFIGTPAYMSPEQAMMTTSDIDTRTDIYSLGVLLYELLTGKTPLDQKELLAAGLEEMRRTIREQEPARPSTRLSTMLEADLTTTAKHRHTDAPRLLHLLRGDLDWIVMKALEKERACRYETANGLAMDIQRHLNNEPVVARPPSSLYQFQKLVRRNKLAFAAVGAVLAALVIGLGISTWQFIEKSKGEREQSRLRQAAQQAQANEAELRRQAETDKQKAQTEAAKSRQVAQFLKDMLAGVGPSVALGRDTILLQEILAKTAERVGRDLKDQPEVEAELRWVIGDAYDELGNDAQALKAHGEALALTKKLFGDENERVATLLDSLATETSGLDNNAEAETLQRQSLAMWRKLRGNESLQVAIAIHDLSLILLRESQGVPAPQQRLTEAEILEREALAMRRKLLGLEHAEVAQSLQGLGIILDAQGKFAEAESALGEALAMNRKLLGGENLATADCAIHLAEVLEHEDKFSEAENLLRRALALRRQLHGSDHPNVAYVLGHLAPLLRREGKLAEAEIMTREALAIYEKKLGREHSYMAGMLNDLAMVLRDEGKLAEAERAFREALEMRRKLLGGEHFYTLESFNGLMNVLQKEGKFAEAEAVHRERLETLRARLPATEPQLAIALVLWTQTLLDAEKFSDAEPVARECLAIREKIQPDDWPTFNTRSVLGGILWNEKRYDIAEPLLLSGYEGLKRREDKLNEAGRLCLKNSIRRVVQLYEATGRADEAAVWKQKLAGPDKAEK